MTGKPKADRPLAPRVGRAQPRLSTDGALGIVGGALAAASATFGVAMTLHGPVSGLGHSGNFTVFAQLKPHRAAADARPAAMPDAGELDDATTASIPQRAAAGAVIAAAPAVTLRAADAGAATIVIGGRETVVRVGDVIPGIGAVLAIVAGDRPRLRTTGGMIEAAALPQR